MKTLNKLYMNPKPFLFEEKANIKFGDHFHKWITREIEKAITVNVEDTLSEAIRRPMWHCLDFCFLVPLNIELLKKLISP